MGKKNEHPLQTGDQFIELAKSKGASVTPHGNFSKVETPEGSVHIAPGRNRLDNQTISNLKRWFRLLKLLLIPLTPAGIALLIWWVTKS